MQTFHQYWFSPKLGHDMGVSVFGHWGPPLLAFPTSHGDEWELQRNSLIAAIGDFIDAGRVKVFCVGSNNHESFLNKQAHPFHRSWRQRMFDEYIRDEVIPYLHASCQTPGIPISGVFDLRDFMDGMYDDNFYFQNPVDYMANLTDSWFLEQLSTCEIRLVTGTGPYEKSAYSYTMSGILARRGIRHSLDDWGPRGGHDWPFWKEQLREYISRW